MITRELIVETALRLFLQNGVKTITVDKIVKELCTSKRTLYQHFGDKSALVKACLVEYNKSVAQENEEVLHSSENVIEALGILLHKIVSRSHEVNPNFYTDVANYHPGLLTESYEEAGQFAHRQFMYIAKWGLDDGIFRDDLDIEVAGKTVVAMLKLCKDSRTFPGKKFSTQRLTFGIILPFLRGNCTDKGIKLVKIQEELFRVSI